MPAYMERGFAQTGSSAHEQGVMLLTVLVLRSLFNGLLSGLDAQAEISEPLEELYYDGLR